MEETKTTNKMTETPNKTTKAACEEARSEKELETLDLKNFRDFVKSL